MADTRFAKGCKKTANWYLAMAKRRGKNHSMWKGGQKVEMTMCECGCQTVMNRYDSRNRPRKRVLGHQMVGRKQTDYQKERLTGPNNPHWIKDRSKLKLDVNNERGSPLHKQWSRDVKNRDGWKCRISNQECSGKVVAHHILAFATHPESRYEVNNGITLCHSHHPRKRNDEIRLAPHFQKLVVAGAN
jgi:hypothetical protein